MSAIENPPAFPAAITVGPAGDVYHGFDGMTLRDWFAGQCIEQCIRNAMCEDGGWDADNVAFHSYLVADAMLLARSQQSSVVKGGEE